MPKVVEIVLKVVGGDWSDATRKRLAQRAVRNES